MQKLYTRCQQNTGMADQPIYVYHTLDKNGKLGSRYGYYSAISADHSRHYKFSIAGQTVEYEGYKYCPAEVDEDGEPISESGFSVEMMCQIFVEHCEELFSNGTFTDVYFKDIADCMMCMSERLNLGWVQEECYSREEYSTYYRIYSKNFAEKCYIGEDVIFCFDEKALVETMAELVHQSTCDFKKHDVIMMYPDDSYDEDIAYVVHKHENIAINRTQRSVIMHEITRLENEMEHIDAIWKKRGIKDATAEPEFVEYEKMLMIRCELGLGVE